MIESKRKFPGIFASKMDEFSVVLSFFFFLSTRCSDIKAGSFAHSSTNAVIMLIEVKGRSGGHRDAEEEKNPLLQN